MNQLAMTVVFSEKTEARAGRTLVRLVRTPGSCSPMLDRGRRSRGCARTCSCSSPATVAVTDGGDTIGLVYTAQLAEMTVELRGFLDDGDRDTSAVRLARTLGLRSPMLGRCLPGNCGSFSSSICCDCR